MLAEIDAVADPKANKSATRVRGTIKDCPPPESPLLNNRARRWMIDPNWLADPENKKFDVPSRIVDSGKMWGDEKDPEDIVDRKEYVKQSKQIAKMEKFETSLKMAVPKESTSKKGKKGKGKEKENDTAMANNSEVVESISHIFSTGTQVYSTVICLAL